MKYTSPLLDNSEANLLRDLLEVHSYLTYNFRYN